MNINHVGLGERTRDVPPPFLLWAVLQAENNKVVITTSIKTTFLVLVNVLFDDV